MSNSSFVVSYTYDIHSWLKHISASNQMTLFEESLMYENAVTPCYNGNIGSMTWKAGNYILQRYDLSYDNASRLVSATYTGGSNNSKDFSASYTYDCMGNITSLKRNGLQDGGTYGPVDNLTLSYDGNRLTSVKDRVTDPTYNNAWNFADGADSSQEYEYDENGNVTKDLNKSILSIEYNPLNLPFRIKFSNGNSIIYTYSADGCKLKAEYTTAMPATTKKIYYCSNLIIEDGKLQQINFEGGYATYVGSLWAYHYFIKDHLGNNRMVVHPSGLNQQPQVTNYYPYGGLMANSTNQDQQRYKYNGKELDRMHGLDWYDFGARWMDAALGRWHSMDRMCEKYYDISPYAFCKNNPINNIDINGDSIYFDMPAIEHGAITGYTRYTYGKYGDTYGFGRNGELYQGNNTTISSISDALNTISGGGTYGLNLVAGLSGNTSKDIRIKYGENNTENITSNEIIVSWHPTITDGCGIDVNGSNESPPFISLAHELYHANDFLTNGNYNAGTWYVHNGNATSYKELQACRFENFIREEHNIPLRAYYAHYENSMIPYPPSKIINLRCFKQFFKPIIK